MALAHRMSAIRLLFRIYQSIVSLLEDNILEDAKAAGHIVLKASQKEGMRVSDWLERIKQRPAQNIKRG
jgi:hypothetical protein